MPQPSTQPPEGHWNYENITPDLIQAERINQVLFKGTTAFQDVQIVDAACFGRSLVLDGKTQSTEVDEFVYHETLVHPSLLAHPAPTQVLVAGGGEGATAREVLAHSSVKRCVMVDIDSEVVSLCRRYLPNHHRGAFEDQRLELHHRDALAFLQETSDRFDVAIIDVPDPPPSLSNPSVIRSTTAPCPSTRRDQVRLNSSIQAPMRVPPSQSSTTFCRRSSATSPSR